MLIFFSYLTVFILGLASGSFLNCIIYRLEKEESFLKGRSYCPYCQYQLSWQDLIPLLSFLMLRGKCRYCQQKISWQYPLVEFFTGVLFVLVSYYSFPNLIVTIYWLIIACFLIIVFVYDLKYYIIPDKVIFPAIFTVIIWDILSINFFNLYTTKYELYSALFAAVFFLLIFLFSRGKWLGFGDVKLALFMGLFLGFPNILLALFSAFFLGAIIGIGLIIFGERTLKSEVPFGPFLVTATFLSLFFGERIISWYLNLFL